MAATQAQQMPRNSGVPLYEISENYRRLIEALEDGADSEEGLSKLLDALSAVGDHIDTKASNVAAFILNLEAEAEVVEKAEKRMAARKKSLMNKASGLRGYLLAHLRACGKTEVAAQDKTFRIKVVANPEKVVVEDENALPEAYVKVETVRTPMKDEIRAALKAERAVSGAKLVQEYRLDIR